MKTLSKLILVFGILLTPHAYAETQYCGKVKIVNFLSGPAHGSMMKVSNPSCGTHDGWVCLDPGAQHMTPEISKRVYAQVLAYHMADKEFWLGVSLDKSATGCNGPYPVIADLRTNDNN